jgi:hypothetical protein
MRHGIQFFSEEISWKKWKQQNKGQWIRYLSNKNGLFIYQLCLYNKSVLENVQKSLMVRLGKCGLMVRMNHLM